jgi:hypothetical protein
MSFKTSFTIDQLELTTDNQSNPIWYISEYNDGSIHLQPEQRFVSHQLYLARALDWTFDETEIWAVHCDEPVIIPIRKAVCTRCRGKGTMANPAFDGTSIEWWQEHGGPDYQDDLYEYMHGTMYDVPCEYNCYNGVAYAADWKRVIDLYHAYGEKEKANKWINDIYYNVLMDWYEGREAEMSERAYFDREWAI